MIIFLHIPRTAGTTFQFILANSFGFRHCHLGYTGRTVITQEDLDFARKLFPGLRSVSGENLVDPLALSAPDPFHITFLRDPVTRVFSHYQDTVLRGRNPMTFEQMLRNDGVLQNLQVKLIAGECNLEKAKDRLGRFDFVGLTEKFDLALHALQRLSPRALNLNYKRKLTARDDAIKRGLEADRRWVEMTQEYNRLDSELYAFAAKEVFPGLCARAGYDAAERVTSFEKYRSVNRPGFLLHRLYNKGFFREVCKVAYRRREPVRESAGAAVAK